MKPATRSRRSWNKKINNKRITDSNSGRRDRAAGGVQGSIAPTSGSGRLIKTRASEGSMESMVTNVVPSPVLPNCIELPTGCGPANVDGSAAWAVFARTVIVALASLRLASISTRRVPAARVPWPFTTMSASGADGAVLSQPCPAHEPDDTEVGEEDRAVRTAQDVAGLNVRVHHAKGAAA
jgi:hypothetical protein